MRFRHELTYDAPPDAVHAMLAEPRFREQVCEAARTLRHEVAITPAGSGMTVVVEQVQPTDAIPSYARKVVGNEIPIRQHEEWTAPEGASLDVTIPGKPGQFRGTITLSASDSGGTRQVVEGEVRVSIPVVGGKLEQLIADTLGAALRNEERVGRGWLAGDPA